MAPSNASSPSSESAPDLEILGDQVALLPVGYVQPKPQDGDREKNLVEHMARFRESPFDFLRDVSLHVSGMGWRSFDNYIGQPIFYRGFTENMKAAVMRTPMLRSKISQLADLRVEVEDKQGLLGSAEQKMVNRARRKAEIEKSLREVALNLSDAMICKMEYKRGIRAAYYMCTQLLTRAYHQGIHVSSEEVLRLRGVAEQAAKKKHSIIFLPCHRSHIDYVSLQIICFRLGIALPTVVAGDNLNIPVLGTFLQHQGAMWIRRSFGGDPLYTTLVQSYIDTLLQNGFNFECFIEGGRSRTGKLLSPKFGILSFVLDSVLSGRVDDAIICPVSTQYDKVIETESYISELLGQPKPKENLQDLLSASSVLSLKLGRVDVRFHEPWSLKTFIADQRARVGNSVTVPRPLRDPQSQESRIRLLRTLGYRVLSDINAVSVVMPTALIGTVLLTLRGRGVGKSELIRRVEWLSERVRSKGGRVAHFGGAPTSVVVERGLDVLGPGLVGIIDDLPETTYYAVDRFQLSFYRNMTIHLFISEALVSASMYTRVKQGGGPDNQRISFTALQTQVTFLSQLFRGEFIYPTAGLLTNLDMTLRGLEADGIITLTRSPGPNPNVTAVELSPTERRDGRENFDFYCFLIWPFIESTWLGAVSLMGLTPPLPPQSQDSAPEEGSQGQEIWLDLTATQNAAQLLGKTLYHQGDLSYFEAVNKETLKNAFTLFQQEGIIVVRTLPPATNATSPSSITTPSTTPSNSTNNNNPPPSPKKDKKDNPKPKPHLRLAPSWSPHRDPATGAIVPEGKLWRFIETIAQSRREGKNRRDGATVSSRVLGLADLVGRGLFEGGGQGGGVRAVSEVKEAGGEVARL